MPDAENAPNTLEDCYVEESARSLDPTLLEGSLIDRLPQPTGFQTVRGAKKNNGLFLRGTLDRV